MSVSSHWINLEIGQEKSHWCNFNELSINFKGTFRFSEYKKFLFCVVNFIRQMILPKKYYSY